MGAAMAHPRNGKPLTVEKRQALEAEHTFRRIVELHLDPVRGKFDAAHLKEINRRIFQDLPGLGFDDVTPGQYRPPVEAGNDWIKSRSLETVEASSNVAYSPMGKPLIRHASTKRDVMMTMDQFEGNRDLPNLLRDAARPARAIAFEQLAESDALRAHSDLGEAFKTMRAASQYFEAKIPGDASARADALLTVRQHVQTKLNHGETRDFRQLPSDKQRVRGVPAK